MREPVETAVEWAERTAALAFRFAGVERATRHPDGIRQESDTDHTVMLALVACGFAPPGLNTARIAELALVHALVEAYAGDTNSLAMTPEAALQKAEREAAAWIQLRREFGAKSWMLCAIDAYEAQQESEARYVKLLDKVLPKLTQALNGCAAVRAKGWTYTEVCELHNTEHAKLEALYGAEPWAPPVLALLRDAMTSAENAWPLLAR